MFIYVRIH